MHITDRNEWVWCLLLGHDEWDAVRLQRGGPVSSPAVKHGQCGEGWRRASVSSHGPQLVSVLMDGVVVVQLNSEAHIAYRFFFSASLEIFLLHYISDSFCEISLIMPS